MCYRVSVNTGKEKLAKKFQVEVKGSAFLSKPYFSVSGFDHPALGVIQQKDPGYLQGSFWGLIPPFIRTSEEARKITVNTLNARSETIFEKASFKKAILENRCLIPIDGFFEWQDRGKDKQPYYIFGANQEPFGLGGISTEWVDPATGLVINTFSIVTTEANELMSEIHNSKKRMPFILMPGHEKEWIKPDLREKDIKEMMQPLPNGILDAFEVSRRLNSRKEDTNVPEILERVGNNGTQQLDLFS